ncbi:MAG: tRNA pseudouridine(38-40) synthase TruA [Deinococcota bacterium]|nr:tRNA pseudouridine(38-40) synthase TruA [Deinococcota bacterium]
MGVREAQTGSLRRVKLTLEYDGAGFFGWQVQAQGERTVQGVLEAALAALTGAKPRVMAAGRTDRGVHALAMVAHYDTADTVPEARVARALNGLLPADVRVLTAEGVAADFEARFSCRYRRYLYKLRLARGGFAGQALERGRVLFLPQRLDVARMIAAAPRFEGRRDFAALATQEERTTEREVYLCRLEPSGSDLSGSDLSLQVAADGFLRGMVRAIVGTLLYVGEGKLAPGDLDGLLATGERRRLGPNAPAHALYFAEAGYEPWPGR